MSIKIHDVDHYLKEGCGRCPLGGTPECKVHNWDNELPLLRSFILESGLTENLKWSQPCYTYQGTNVLILSALKDYCIISFLKGSLIDDPHNLLVKPGKNSQAVRYLQFNDIGIIKEKKDIIKAYLLEAIELEKQGKKVTFKKNPKPIPEELKRLMQERPDLKKAFNALTPGRQRGYILYFSQPKKSKTRVSRIEKYVDKILEGKGFHDR